MTNIKPKLSVIISTLNEPSHLWFTISSFREQIFDLGNAVQIIVGDNSPIKQNYCRNRIHDIKFVPVERNSTSLIRNMAAKEATGDLLCFADTHLVLSNGLLKRVLSHFDNNKNLGILHTRTTFWGCGDGFYYYKLNLDETFSGINWNKNDLNKTQPFLVPASGHGLFFIRRSVFEQIGGYLEEQTGWGGEEIFLDLLVWEYGYEVMCDPLALHWHLPGDFTRPYCRNGVQFILNHMFAAYVIGGDIWLNKVAEHYKLIEYEAVTRFLPDIPRINIKRRSKVVEEAEYTLEEVMKMWDDYGIQWRVSCEM